MTNDHAALGLLVTPPVRVSHPPHRVHESPLTFLRSRSTQGGSASSLRRSSVASEVEGRGLGGGFGFADFMRETFACLSGTYAEKQRRRLYETADLELQVHETLDTLAVRGLQTWFSWQHSAVAGASARLAVKPDNRKSYVLKLKDDDVAVAVFTNVVERIAETVPFLADPNNCWTCEASEMHILLSSHSARDDLLDLTPARRVCLCSSPVELRLAKLVWRRNGTLWAQWRVVRGNVDRLRADLRVVSGAKVAGTFARTTEDPTRTRPFFVECLVMAVLHKPSSGDFRTVRALTEQLCSAFADTPCLLKHVYRLRSELCPLDRTGLYDVLPLMSQFPVIEGDLNRLIWGAKVLQASPCVRRIAGICAGATLAACWLAWKKSSPR